MGVILDMPERLTPEDIIWECKCGYERFWITKAGFQCCGCGKYVDFKEVSFDI